MFLTSKYAALTGERIKSTQPLHRTQKKKKRAEGTPGQMTERTDRTLGRMRGQQDTRTVDRE